MKNVITVFILMLSVTTFAQVKSKDFKKPIIEFVNTDKSEKGELYHKIVKDPQGLIQETSLKVCQVLYRNIDEIPDVQKINYKVHDYAGVSAKGGRPPVINIQFSTRHLAKIFEKNPNDTIGVYNEIVGVLSHELVHAYQHDDNDRYSEIGGVIEGIADAVRTLLGYKDYNKKKPGGCYKDAYETSAFFFVWIERNKCDDFIYKLNQSMVPDDGITWTWDEVKKITGIGVVELWNEYQQNMHKDVIRTNHLKTTSQGFFTNPKTETNS